MIQIPSAAAAANDHYGDQYNEPAVLVSEHRVKATHYFILPSVISYVPMRQMVKKER